MSQKDRQQATLARCMDITIHPGAFGSSTVRLRRRGYQTAAVSVVIALLFGCRTPPQANPLAYIPADVVDYKQSDFVENQVLVVQTCLPDKRIPTGRFDVRMPDAPAPLTVCQRRQSLGQPCPSGWQSSEPLDTGGLVGASISVRVWTSSDDAQNILRRWIPTGDVRRSQYVNSAGGSHSYLRDTTTIGQPVFDYSYTSNARDLFAWSVTREVDRNGKLRSATFWFKPPAGLRLNEFSPWRTADVEEPGEKTGWSYAGAMANNADFPASTPGPGSPSVRFGLFTYRRHEDGNRRYDYVSKHSYLRAKDLSQKEVDTFQILRTDATTIPAC